MQRTGSPFMRLKTHAAAVRLKGCCLLLSDNICAAAVNTVGLSGINIAMMKRHVTADLFDQADDVVPLQWTRKHKHTLYDSTDEVMVP